MVRPGKVYIRIFISFVILLVITEIAIFGFFILFAGRQYREHYERYNATRFSMAQKMVEYQLEKSPPDSDANKVIFNRYLNHMSVALKTTLWLTDDSGKVIAQSFEGEFPSKKIKRYMEYESEPEERFSNPFFENYRRIHPYRTVTIEIPDKRQSTFHMIFDDRPDFKYKAEFAIGLVGIGVIIALMTIPVARMMTRPIKTLIASTKRLEKGDLTHRTPDKRKDEMGELAVSFNKMAEKLERMVNSGKELTAQVSHELRSPLARIQIAVEILKDRLIKSGEEDVNQHLKEIQIDVQELDRLIGRILELSKLDLKEDVPYTEVFSPIILLKNALERYQGTLKTKKINLQLDLSAGAKIMGNRESFNTVIHNLLDNASRYSPVNGFIKVDSHLNNGNLELGFVNSCGHIENSELARIFEPFYRLDHQEESGGGLGLAISKRIIEKHKGTIKADSSEKGLALIIRVPTVQMD
jgi:signal transduction histidine kinase